MPDSSSIFSLKRTVSKAFGRAPIAPKRTFLRPVTILQIEAVGRGHDAFVYLPSLRKVRRFTTSQRGDAFFGTDVTYVPRVQHA